MHQMQKLAYGLLVLLFCTISQISIAAITDAQKLSVLDPAWYLNTYPDLKAALGNNMQAAQSHWVNHGLKEGRNSAPNFSINAYLTRYPDLQKAFGNNYAAALEHWLVTGSKEGRDARSVSPSVSPASQTRMSSSNKEDIQVAIKAPPPQSKPRPDLVGKLLAAPGTPTTFMVDRLGMKRGLPSPEVANGCGLNLGATQQMPATELNTISDGGGVASAAACLAARGARMDLAGKLLAAPGTPMTLMIDRFGMRRGLPSVEVANGCGLNLGATQQMPAAELNAIGYGGTLTSAADCLVARGARIDLAGKLLVAPGTPTTFMMDRFGMKRGLPSPEVASGCGLNLGATQQMQAAELNAISDGGVVVSAAACLAARGARIDLAGKLLLAPGTPTTFMVDRFGMKRGLPSPVVASGCGLNLGATQQMKAAELNAIGYGGTLASAAECLAARGARIDLAGKLLQATGTPTIFVMDSFGIKHGITSLEVANGCGLNLGTIRKMSAGEVNAINDGGNVASAAACLALGVSDAPPSGPEKLDTVDPIEVILTRAQKSPKAKLVVPQLTALLTPLKGLIIVTEAEGRSDESPIQIFKVKGNLDLNRIQAAKLKPPVYPVLLKVLENELKSGFSSIKKQGVPVANPRAAFNMFLYNTAALTKKLGLRTTIPIELTLNFANNEFDLVLSQKIVENWIMTGEIVPLAKSQMALKEVELLLHSKKKLTGAMMEFSAEVAGKMFAKPTFRDPWLGVNPSAEVNSEGEITIGGDFSGACGGPPTPASNAADCTGEWDVFNMKVVKSQGGTLKLTFFGGEPTGIEAAVKNGRFGPNGMEVDGAVLVDMDLTPGAGLILKTRQKAAIKDVVAFFPLANMIPFSSLSRGLNHVDPNLALSRQADIMITPTGLTIGHYNETEPVISIQAEGKNGVSEVKVDLRLKGDLEQILRGNTAGALKGGYMKYDLNYQSIINSVKSGAAAIPVIGPLASGAVSTFYFSGATAMIDLSNSRGSGRINYTLLNKPYSQDMPVDNVFYVESITKVIVDKIKELVTIPGKEVLEALMKIPDVAVMLSKDFKVGAEGAIEAVPKMIFYPGILGTPGFWAPVGDGAADFGKQIGNALNPSNWF